MQPSPYIIEPARKVPVWHECDICVVGGSCTGLFAAIRAARLGARVAIIEQQNCFGGVATTGMVSVWHSLHDTAYRQQIIAGLTSDVLDRLHRRGAASFIEHNADRGSIFNPSELKVELDALASAAGIRVFFHTMFVAPHLDDGQLRAVIVENKSGRGAITAAMFVDATGDGDLAVRAGVPFYQTDQLQPATTCAHFSGWSTLEGVEYGKTIRDNREAFDLPDGFDWNTDLPDSDMRMLAGTRVYGDLAIADTLTAGEIEGRRQVRAIMEILRAAAPHSRLVLQALPSRIGIRETRHLRCRYQLSGDDVLNGRQFDDAIANGSYRVDIHHQDKPGITFRYLDGVEHYLRPGSPCVTGRWRPETAVNPTYYQIPYRSLLPRTHTNLIVAGRMLDADATAFGAVRVMVNCNQTGEAAGVATWLALDSHLPLADIDPQSLRRHLADGGSIML